MLSKHCLTVFDEICNAVAACRLHSAGSPGSRIGGAAEPDAAVDEFQAAVGALQQTLTDTAQPRRHADGEPFETLQRSRHACSTSDSGACRVYPNKP